MATLFNAHFLLYASGSTFNLVALIHVSDVTTLGRVLYARMGASAIAGLDSANAHLTLRGETAQRHAARAMVRRQDV